MWWAVFTFGSLAGCQKKASDVLPRLTGVSWAELHRCDADGDCVLVPGLSGCCHGEHAIRREHQAVFSAHQAAAWRELTSSEEIKACATMNCVSPTFRAVCRNHECALEGSGLPAGQPNDAGG